MMTKKLWYLSYSARSNLYPLLSKIKMGLFVSWRVVDGPATMSSTLYSIRKKDRIVPYQVMCNTRLQTYVLAQTPAELEWLKDIGRAHNEKFGLSESFDKFLWFAGIVRAG